MPIVIRRKVVAPLPEPVITPVKAAPGEMLDGMCRAVMAKGPNSVVSWWLMAGYMYYVHDTPIISDALFDEMAKVMDSELGRHHAPAQEADHAGASEGRLTVRSEA